MAKKKKKKKAPIYNPLAGWNQTLPQMRQNAARQAQDRLAALISALPSQAALRDAQAREAQGLGRLNTAFVNRLNQTAQSAAQNAAGITTAYQQAAAGANRQANGLAAAVGGPAVSGANGGQVLAAMGAGISGALAGNAQAGAAMGTLSQHESLARLAAALKDRQAQVTSIRGRYGAFFDDALNNLYSRAMQQATARDNSRLAWSQFGEQQQQNDINNAQQDAAQTAAEQQAAAANALDWAQLSAQQQAAMAQDTPAGKKERQAYIKKLRRQFYKQRNETKAAYGPIKRFAFEIRTVDDDGQVHTEKVAYDAETEAKARAQLYAAFPQYVGAGGAGGNSRATITMTGSKPTKTVKQRVYTDKELADRYRKVLRRAGFQEQEVTRFVNNWLRLEWGKSR